MRWKAARIRKLVESDASFNWSWRRTSRWQRASLLRMIAVGIEERLPLAPLLDAWASDERGIQRIRVRRMATLIGEGASLPDALEAAPGALRDEDVLAIRFGAQSGTLAASARAALADLEANPHEQTSGVRGTIAYYVLVTLVLLGIAIWMQFYVSPKILEIAAEFEQPTPEPLGWSMRIMSFIAQFWWVAALGVLALAWSAFSLRPGRFVRHRLLGRHVRPLRDLRSAEVLDKLSVAAQAGRPIPGALSTLARFHFDPVIRQKLLFVRNEVEQGADAWQSLSAAGLVTSAEVDAIEASGRVGNRPWALKQLADSKRRRTRQYVRRARDLLAPAAALVLGAFVLLQALAMFIPLRNFILAQ